MKYQGRLRGQDVTRCQLLHGSETTARQSAACRQVLWDSSGKLREDGTHRDAKDWAQLKNESHSVWSKLLRQRHSKWQEVRSLSERATEDEASEGGGSRPVDSDSPGPGRLDGLASQSTYGQTPPLPIHVQCPFTRETGALLKFGSELLGPGTGLACDACSCVYFGHWSFAFSVETQLTR